MSLPCRPTYAVCVFFARPHSIFLQEFYERLPGIGVWRLGCVFSASLTGKRKCSSRGSLEDEAPVMLFPQTSLSCCCANCSRLNYAKLLCSGSFLLANLLRGIMIMPNFAIGLIGRYPLARVSSVSIIYNVYGCCNGDSLMANQRVSMPIVSHASIDYNTLNINIQT